MKTLLIMRHAKSSWSNPGLSDHDRPLNERGEGDAPRMGAALNEMDLVPDLILTSTALRARRTAELVAEHCPFEGEIKLVRSFYHAGVDEYLSGIQAHTRDESVVMIVGHNPGMSEFLDYLTDQPETLTTANIAVVRLDIDDWEDFDFETEGELVEVLRPREL